MPSELEKIQIQRAQIQLERERRRDAAAQQLMRGVGRGSRWAFRALIYVVLTPLLAILGAAIGWAVVAFTAVVHAFDYQRSSSASWAELIGSALGRNHDEMLVAALIGAIVVPLFVFWEYHRSR